MGDKGRSLSKLGYDCGHHNTSDGSAGETSLAKCNFNAWYACDNSLADDPASYGHNTKMSDFIIEEGELQNVAFIKSYSGTNIPYEQMGTRTFDEDWTDGGGAWKVSVVRFMGNNPSFDGSMNFCVDSRAPEFSHNARDRSWNYLALDTSSGTWGESLDYYMNDGIAPESDLYPHTFHISTINSIYGDNIVLHCYARYVGVFNQYDKDTGDQLTNWNTILEDVQAVQG